MAATTASVCGYDTHVQNSTSTPGNLSVVPTHGQLLLLLLLSLSFHYLLSPFWWLEKEVGGGPKGISLAKYVSTCLHIPDLYVEYSRPAVSLDSEISLSLSLFEDASLCLRSREEGNEFYASFFTPASANPRPWSAEISTRFRSDIPSVCRLLSFIYLKDSSLDQYSGIQMFF